MDKSEANFDPGGQSQELRSDSRKTLPVSGEPGGAENSGGKSSGIYVELNQYKQEVRYLKGRIQGYQMLSKLLQHFTVSVQFNVPGNCIYSTLRYLSNLQLVFHQYGPYVCGRTVLLTDLEGKHQSKYCKTVRKYKASNLTYIKAFN